MEITNQNAAVMLPCIADLLRDCAFVAIDLEFSGIDRDGPEEGAETPEQFAHSLMRKPANMYAAKLEGVRPYSVVQIGLSIFTSITANTDGAAAAAPVKLSAAPELAAFLSPSDDDHAHFAALTASVEEAMQDPRGGAAGYSAASKYVSERLVQVAAQMEQLSAAASTGDCADRSAPAERSLPRLCHRLSFLEALGRAVSAHGRAAAAVVAAASAAANGLTKSPPAQQQSTASHKTRYRVQTFSALLFPAASDLAVNVTLNVDTAEFLVKNDIDLTRWIKDGLRFEPIKTTAAQLCREAEKRLAQVEQLTQPHTHVPGYRDRLGKKLDELLPLSPGELQFVRFVIDLPAPGGSDPAAARTTPYFVGITRPLIMFSRGLLEESALPDSLYTRDKLYQDERDALSAIGVVKANKKFARAPVSNKSNGENTGKGCNSIFASHNYGNTLLETLLYATEVRKKPIVFFNGYTDLMFLLLTIYGAQNMPADLAAFKAVTHAHFPCLYDTRVLSCAGALQGYGNFTGKLSSVVEEMARVGALSNHVSFHFDPFIPGGADASQFLAAHAAAFDAQLTGKLFAFAKHGLEGANVSLNIYKNFLASYTTLMSISLEDADDGVLQELPTQVFYLPDAAGMRVDTIRDALAARGVVALVMFRGVGYTIQPVGAACSIPNLAQVIGEAVSARAHTSVPVYSIPI